MEELIAEYYNVIKALHIIAVISWMAGMLYLPRIFVYHTKVSKDSEAYNIFCTMEKKLLKYIMNPSMIFVFVLGFLMLWFSGISGLGMWIHYKLLLVFIMAGLHGFYSVCCKKFIKKENAYSEKFYRIINEVPAIMMVAIVFLVILKP